MAETRALQLDKNTQLMEDIHSPTLTPSGDALLPQRTSARGSLVREPIDERIAPRRSRSVIETAAHLAGRGVFGGFFIYNGINHFLERKKLSGYVESKGVPAPDAAVVSSGLLLLAGGICILAGVRPKVGASLVATFLLGISPVMHAFWKETDPQQQMNEMVNFSKNMALVGGAMLAAGTPEPWPAGVRTRSRF